MTCLSANFILKVSVDVVYDTLLLTYLQGHPSKLRATDQAAVSDELGMRHVGPPETTRVARSTVTEILRINFTIKSTVTASSTKLRWWYNVVLSFLTVEAYVISNAMKTFPLPFLFSLEWKHGLHLPPSHRLAVCLSVSQSVSLCVCVCLCVYVLSAQGGDYVWY